MCEDGVISISAEARDMIRTMNWYELTGCPGGYPDHVMSASYQFNVMSSLSPQSEVHRDYTQCMAGCGNDPRADEYCQMADIITPVSYGGIIIMEMVICKMMIPLQDLTIAHTSLSSASLVP